MIKIQYGITKPVSIDNAMVFNGGEVHVQLKNLLSPKDITVHAKLHN